MIIKMAAISKYFLSYLYIALKLTLVGKAELRHFMVGILKHVDFNSLKLLSEKFNLIIIWDFVVYFYIQLLECLMVGKLFSWVCTH